MSERVWTVKAALDWTQEFLAERSDEHPRRSAEWLLSAATGLSRLELYAYHDRPLAPEERTVLRESVRRRAAGEPLQYVTGEVAFRHLVLKVRPGVLIPRPETEILVGELLVELGSMGAPIIADICTGSGCIALSLAQEKTDARVWATDISQVAVDVAAENAQRLGLADRVGVAVGDLFEALPVELLGTLDAVISNPPYIPSSDVPDLPREVAGFEPHLALDGGPDGLDFFRRLIGDARAWLKPGGVIAIELDERMVRIAAQEAQEWYEEVRVVSDLAGRDRIVVARFAGRP
ncbi:MAG: peptide chain release factor N(5)-glutamine methyltransferase [Actinobacteria bacterium HGW-Actinobacteria-7]|nr:MAG: peptide chain release factor N(5)-glutamine methyltransferase [Actinobacteria bacterium HGW-Actinobacteria-7]